MSNEQVQEMIRLMRAIVGALGDIQEAIEKLAAEKKPPSSKRGGR